MLKALRILLLLYVLSALTLVAAIPSASAQGGAQGPTSRYIVQLTGSPLATYGGGINGYAPTAAQVAGGSRLDVDSAASRDYLDYLERKQLDFEAALADAIPSAKVEYNYDILLNALAVSLPDDPKSLRALARLPGVVGIAPEQAYTLSLDQSVPLIQAPALWALLGGVAHAGEGIKVAILDSGIWNDQPFFDPSTFSYPPGYPKGDVRYTTHKIVAARAYFRPGDPPAAYEPHNPLDGNDHGSHVAGIVAGVSGTSTRLGKISGVAPRAWLMNYKLFYTSAATGAVVAFTPEIVAAMEDAVADGADVCNASWGGTSDLAPEADPMVIAADAMVEAGVVVVFAAGNEGPLPNTIDSPAISSRAIAVGNTTTARYGSTPDVVAGTSSHGPGLGLSIKPDLTAPGSSIYSSIRTGFAFSTGTSMAAPHVSGSAALLKQLHRDWTPEQIKAALMTTADVNVTYGGKPAGVMTQGAGRIDLAAAPDPGLLLWPPSISWGEVPAGTSVRATISAIDVAGGGVYSVTVEGPDATSGVSVTASVESLSVADGEQGALELTLNLAPGAVPGEYEGRIWLSNAEHELHVPWWARVVAGSPRADILLLDDDASSMGAETDYAPYYTGLLDQLGLTYDVWDVGTHWLQTVGRDVGGLPTAAYMANYRAVIWFTGDSARTYNQTGARKGDRLAALDYLESGGRLIVTGRDFVGYALGAGDDTSLISIGLGVDDEEIHQNAYSPAAYASPFAAVEGLNSSLAFAGMLFDLGAPDVVSPTIAAGAGNANGVDELVAIPDYDAAPILRILMPGSLYAGTVGVAKASDPTLEESVPPMPPGRSLSLSFGLESINDDTAYTTRSEFLTRALDWLWDDLHVGITDGAAANPFDLVTLRAAMTSTVASGEAASLYRWDLGDGSDIIETERPSVSYAYGQAGVFHPRVEAIDALGHSAVSLPGTVAVADAPITQSFPVYVPLLSAGTSSEESTSEVPGPTGLRLVAAGLDGGASVGRLSVGRFLGLSSASEVAVPSALPDISDAQKLVDKTFAREGESVGYQLIAHNQGDADAALQIWDDLPITAAAGFVPTSLRASSGVAYWEPALNGGYGAVHWAGSVAPGQGITITYQMQIIEGAIGGTLITNTARFTETTTGATLVKTATTQVVGVDLGASTKSVDKSQVLPGDQLSYMLVAQSTGSIESTVQITDRLPHVAGLTLEKASLVASKGQAIWNAAANDGFGAITWQGQIGPGEQVALAYLVTVGERVFPGVVLTNTATLRDVATGLEWERSATSVVMGSDLSGSYKAVDREVALPGQTLHYTIVVSNDGNAAVNARAEDNLPQLDLVRLLTETLAASNGVVTYDAAANQGYGKVRWDGLLAPYGSAVISFTMQTDDLIPEGTVVTNAATIQDLDLGKAWTSGVSTLIARPDLSASHKRVNLVEVRPGETLAYTIVCENDSDAWADARVLDVLPRTSAVILISQTLSAGFGEAVWHPEQNAGFGAITWEGMLGPSEAVTITYGLYVNPYAAGGTLITNETTFSEAQTGQFWQDSVTSQVVAPNISASRKTVDRAYAQAGDTLSYALIAANQGNTPTVMQVRDDLPRLAGLQLISDTLAATAGEVVWTPGDNDGYGALYWTGPVGAGKAVTITFDVALGASVEAGTIITNSAEFGDSTGQQVEDQAVTHIVSTDLVGSYKQVDKAQVRAGQMLTYTLVARNSGTFATTALVTDTLPRLGGLTMLTDTLTSTKGLLLWDAAANGGYGSVGWQGEVAAGEGVTITFQMLVGASITPGSIITNTAAFYDSFSEERFTAQTRTQVFGPNIISSRKLVSKAMARPGDILTYTVLGRNTGNYTATLVITDVLPDTWVLSVITPSLHADWGQLEWLPEANGGHGLVSWHGEVGSLRVVRIMLDAQIGTSGLDTDELTNLAVIKELGSGAVVTDTAVTGLRLPQLAASKTVDKSSVTVGRTLSYSLVAMNEGDVDATVQISDPLPHLGYISLDEESLAATAGRPLFDQGANGGYGQILWLGSLGPDEVVTVTFDVNVSPMAPSRDVITNTATFFELRRGQELTRSASAMVLGPDLSGSYKSVDKSMARPGDVLTYTLVVSNVGEVWATARITDSLPQVGGMHYVPGSLYAERGQALFDSDGNDGFGVVSWVGRADPGQSIMIEFQVELDDSAPQSEVITNRAMFWDTTRDIRRWDWADTLILPPLRKSFVPYVMHRIR